jgi:hypothetical protein
VDEAVDSHLGDAHHRGNFGNGQEMRLGDLAGRRVVSHGAPIFL